VASAKSGYDIQSAVDKNHRIVSRIVKTTGGVFTPSQ
jgi:hypothetical protein